MKDRQDAPPEVLERLRTLFDARDWRYAKTMPWVPHWYSLRKHWPDDSFVWAVEAIRRYGYDDQYGKRIMRALNVNGSKYWTMGNPVPETTLINRKPVPDKDAWRSR